VNLDTFPSKIHKKTLNIINFWHQNWLPVSTIWVLSLSVIWKHTKFQQLRIFTTLKTTILNIAQAWKKSVVLIIFSSSNRSGKGKFKIKNFLEKWKNQKILHSYAKIDRVRRIERRIESKFKLKYKYMMSDLKKKRNKMWMLKTGIIDFKTKYLMVLIKSYREDLY